MKMNITKKDEFEFVDAFHPRVVEMTINSPCPVSLKWHELTNFKYIDELTDEEKEMMMGTRNKPMPLWGQE